MFRFWSLAVVLAFFAGCSKPEDDAKSRLREVDTRQLRFEAAKLYNRVRNSPNLEFFPIKPALWPPTFQKLAPIRVGSYADGFALVFSGPGQPEAGLHVQPLGMDKTPQAALMRYERLEEGIFWFRAK